MDNTLNLQHPDPEIQRLARKHYNEDPKTKELVDNIFASGRVIQEKLEYGEADEPTER